MIMRMSASRVCAGTCAAVLAAAFWLQPRVCSAVTVTFHFTGTVDTVFDGSGALGSLGVVDGSPISLIYSFDSDTPDGDPGTRRGSYDAVTSLDLEVAGFIAAGIPAGTITIENNFLIYGARQDGYYLNIPITSAQPPGAISVNFSLVDVQKGAFSSDALPLLPPDLIHFESRSITLLLGPALVLGTLDTLVLVLPEPSPMLLVLLALVVLARYRFGAARSRKMLVGRPESRMSQRSDPR